MTIPEFETGDPFLTNILSAAMLASVYLELTEKPNLEQVTDFYHHAMTNNIIMRCYLKRGSKYTAKAQAKLKRQGEESARRSGSNPYTWCFRYEAGKDINSYSGWCCITSVSLPMSRLQKWRDAVIRQLSSR